MGIARTAWALAANGLRYRYLKATGKACRPQAVSLEVTHRCIARCRMCNIWKIPREVPDLPLPDWTRVLASRSLADLRELDITGGEPFLREDLKDLVLAVCELKKTQFRGLRTVAVTTNGFLTNRILECTRAVVQALSEGDIDLVFACGLDAVGPLHDEIRGFPGGWARLLETLSGLKQIRDTHDHVVLGIKATIAPWNVDHLGRIADFAQENGLFTIISPCIITANRYGNLDLEEDLRFGPDQIQQMVRFYESCRFDWDFHREALLTFFHSGRMKKPCTAGFNYFFVRSTGDVYPCPLMPTSVGNLTRQPLDAILQEPALAQFRRGVGSFPECRGCTEPGLERFSLPFEGFAYLRLLPRMGPRAFLDLHRHMGLEKYE